MALQHNPDCLPPHAGDQFALDGLFSYQPDRPARPPFGRRAADHGDNALFLGVVEKLRGPRSLLVVKGTCQTVTVVAMGDLTDRFGSERKRSSDLRRSHSTRKLLQHQSPQHDAHLLNAAAQKFADLGQVFGLNLNRDWLTCHIPSIHKNISQWKCFIQTFSGGPRPRREHFCNQTNSDPSG